MADDTRVSPYLFSVEIDGIQTARFQKCEGLEARTAVYEIEEGGLAAGSRKFYGSTRYPNLVLEKGVTDNEELFTWYRQTVLEDKKVERKNGSVILKDAQGAELKRWNFFRAFPCRWVGPRLEGARAADFALERIEIAHEGLVADAT
ncbi:MAG: phage tail protein [Spirochaetales bacterium]|jgi:phage tail-like protein|nr:phage tail protein [Spirochaetales bacterium]